MAGEPRDIIAAALDVVEQALVAHRLDDEARACTCGEWKWEPGPARPSELHRLHQSERVLAALTDAGIVLCREKPGFHAVLVARDTVDRIIPTAYVPVEETP